MHQTWPAARFYWALLDAPGVKARAPGPLPPGLLADLAEEVPVPVEELHAVAAPAGGSLLVCAARRSDLSDLPPHVLRLVPAGTPAGLAAGDLSVLNLLVGEFEPRDQRRERERRQMMMLGTFVLVSAMAAIGLFRRTAQSGAVARDAALAAGRAVAAWLPPGAPPEALNAEVSRLKQASQATTQVNPAPDAALALAALLRAWPATVPCKPQSIAVTETGITVSVLVEGDARPFLQAFAPPEGWTMEEPRVNSADKFVRIAIDLKPSAAAVGGHL
jgi:hypothetical protein